jgi:transposase-like protein
MHSCRWGVKNISFWRSEWDYQMQIKLKAIPLDTKRSRYARLNEAQRSNAIGRLEASESQTAVARIFNVSQSTIFRLWDRYQQTGSTRDLPRLGRPRVTTAAQDRYIQLRHLRERFTTATSTTLDDTWSAQNLRPDSQKPPTKCWDQSKTSC